MFFNIFQIEKQVRDEISEVNSNEREEKLIDIAVNEKYNHQKTREDRDEFKKDAFDANEKLGGLKKEKVSHNFSHISSILSLKGLGKNSSG